MTNGQLTHSGDPRLARQVANCTLKVDARGQRLAKEHKHSRRRIDLAVAAVGDTVDPPGVSIVDSLVRS